MNIEVFAILDQIGDTLMANNFLSWPAGWRESLLKTFLVAASVAVVTITLQLLESTDSMIDWCGTMMIFGFAFVISMAIFARRFTENRSSDSTLK